jgi:hypothetical protein
MLYLASILCLTSGGLLFGLCGRQWMQGVPGDERDSWLSATERLRLRENVAGNDQAAASPLLRQAEALALYLNPPKPPAPPAAARPRVNPPPAPRPAATTPKFRLLSTSCHHSRPEQSLALVSEPGKGEHWVRKGDSLGHLVVEGIKDGTLIYRDGGQLQEVTVTTKQAAELARVASTAGAATPSVKPEVTLVNALRTKAPGRQVPNAPRARYEQE